MDTTAIKRRRAAARAEAPPDELALAKRALDTLRDLGIDPNIATKPPANRHADLAVTLRRGAKRITYLTEVKRTLRPATLGPVLLRLREMKVRALLLTEYITPPMAKLLRDTGIAFADAAGNAYLEFGGDVFYVIGHMPEQRPRAEKVVRAFQPAGLRVAFALLCAPELIARPTRDLADRLGVANGTVGRVIDDLAHLDFITRTDRRTRRLRNLKGLFERWVMMYPAQLRPTLLRGRFAAETADWWKAEKFDGNHVALGGQAAADRLTQHLKPGLITLYARGEPRPLNQLMVRHRLRADPNGNVEVLNAFWPVELPAEKAGLVPTPLIYADLLATGDARCIETAKLIYDEYLAQRFREA
jgi:hypothetical protein